MKTWQSRRPRWNTIPIQSQYCWSFRLQQWKLESRLNGLLIVFRGRRKYQQTTDWNVSNTIFVFFHKVGDGSLSSAVGWKKWEPWVKIKLGNTWKYVDFWLMPSLSVQFIIHLSSGIWKIYQLGGCALVGTGCMWFLSVSVSCYALFLIELHFNLLSCLYIPSLLSPAILEYC